MLATFYYYLTLMMQPVFKGLIKKRVRAGKEDPERLNERMGRPAKNRPDGPLVWFHGASVGESLSALPLINRILTEQPNTHVMVTTGTVTSARLMKKHLQGRAFHQFIPIDHPKWVKGFLDHWRPDAVIWLESDFWPNMLFEIQRRQIPAVLMNARMGQTSFEKWSRFAPGSLQKILKTFDICMTQSAEEQARLKHFKHPDVRVSDNLKYASPRLSVDQDKKNQLEQQIAERPVWQYASTHSGEEELAVTVHTSLKRQFPDILTVIIPRHPDRGAEIKGLMETSGLVAARRSAGDRVTTGTDVYIADTMGEMGIFFDLIPLTVIGGSFVVHGGHNPIEPGQFGNMVMYGPHMFNFKLMCEDFEKAGASCPLSSIEELTSKIQESLNNPETMQPYRQAALALTQEKSKALDNLWADVSPWLEKSLTEKVGSQ